MIINQIARISPSKHLLSALNIARTLPNVTQKSSLHLTRVLCSKKAGRHKTSIKHDKPLTYEEANKPDMIGVRKSWNSFNTSALWLEGRRTAECAQEDVLIRKFIHGAWPGILASDVIIKRRANLIVINFMALRSIRQYKLYWLVGFTEEILSYVLKSVVKVEIQTLNGSDDLIYKYI